MADEKLLKKIANEYRKFLLVMSSETAAWNATLNQYTDLKNDSNEKKHALFIQVKKYIGREKREASAEENLTELQEIEQELPAEEDDDYEERAERTKNWQKEQVEKDRQEHLKKLEEERKARGRDEQFALPFGEKMR